MKKRQIISLLLACCLCGMLGACRQVRQEGVPGIPGEEPPVEDLDYTYDWQEYIVPGGYTQIEVPANDAQITDELVDWRIRENLENFSEQQPVEDRGIADGDTVYFSYTSTVKGETLEGGEAENQMLTVGAGEVLEGFDTALLGARAGDVVSFSLTYPADFWDDLYAGEQVDFQVTVTDVTRTIVPELTDDLVQVISEHSGTVADYRDEVREQLLEEYQSSMELTRETVVWQKALEYTDVLSYPEELLEAEKASMMEEYRQMAEEEGLTLEELLDQSKESGEDLEETAQYTAERKVLQHLLQQALFDLEELTVTDADYQTYGEAQAPEQGYDSLADWEAAEGKDAVMEEVCYRVATAYLLSQAVEVDTDNDPAAVLGMSFLEQTEEN